MMENMNLVPQDVLAKQQNTRNNIIAGIFFVLTLLLLVLTYGMLYLFTMVIDKQVEITQENLTKAEKNVAEHKRLISGRDELRDRERLLQILLQQTNDPNKINWSEVFTDLSLAIPDGVWLTSFYYEEPNPGTELAGEGIVYVEGASNNHLLISKFMTKLDQSNFQYIDFEYATKEKKVKTRRGEKDTIESIEYKITCKLVRRLIE